MFILQGPEDDEEPESDLSVTEMKQQRQERLAAAEAERARAEAEEEERVKKEAERGIDWGMGRYNIAIIDGTTSLILRTHFYNILGLLLQKQFKFWLTTDLGPICNLYNYVVFFLA